MNNKSAGMFLQSLLERIEIDTQTGKYRLPGYLSSYEISAIKSAIEIISPENSFANESLVSGEENNGEPLQIGDHNVVEKQDKPIIDIPQVDLNLSSLEKENEPNENVYCHTTRLDFPSPAAALAIS